MKQLLVYSESLQNRTTKKYHESIRVILYGFYSRSSLVIKLRMWAISFCFQVYLAMVHTPLTSPLKRKTIRSLYANNSK
jgi:hypothetical protein